MEHYICTGGCKGVSEKPGVCQNPDCPNYNGQLEKCDCEDGNHYGAFDLENNKDSEEENY